MPKLQMKQRNLDLHQGTPGTYATYRELQQQERAMGIKTWPKARHFKKGGSRRCDEIEALYYDDPFESEYGRNE